MDSRHKLMFALGVPLLLAWAGNTLAPAQARSAAPVEANRTLVRRLYEEVWGKGDTAVMDQLATPGFAIHDPGYFMGKSGSRGYADFVTMWRKAYPDIHYTLEDVVADRDRVAARWTWRATHRGPLLVPGVGTLPPSNRPVTVRGMSMFRVVDGKLAEGWVSQDDLGLMQQLGTLSAPARQ